VSSYAHPGSIQAEVGRILEKICLNIEQQDMKGLWNFTQALQRACRVYMEKGEQWKQVKELAHPGTLDPGAAFENMMERQYLCLAALHDAKIYGYGTPEMGSSDGLVAP
jgi:hypothetical protein